MDVTKTLLYMNPEINVVVWENDIDRIEYNETEKFRPTKAEILAVDQSLVEKYWNQREEEDRKISLQDIQNQINNLLFQLNNLKET